jgi:peptidoglycan/LPS O-acetylase OafA/YrhL
MTSGDNAGRVHQLDALRAGALLLGVLGHATISFFPDPEWVADDIQSSPVLLVANFVAHIFRMSLFFAIAGFFAHLLLHKRGARGFITNRLKRIALPFLAFWPVLLACLVVVAFWNAGWANPFAGQGSGGPAPAASGGAPAARALWQVVPLGHTWFLYVLLWLYAAALGVVGLAKVLDPKGRAASAVDAIVRALAVTHLLPFVLAVPLGAVFLFHEHWTAAGGIRTPDFGLVPNLAALVAFGTAFTFGWYLHRQPELLNVWQRWWAVYWIAAVALTAYCARVMSGVTSGGAVLPSALREALLVAAVYPLAIWAWCLALLGAATRFLSAENEVIRYLSDSSYWIYLVHLPLVVALQVWVSQWPLAWQLKYPLILAIAIPILLASYQLLVRNTFLGAWLNGSRASARASRSAATA